MAVPGLRSVVGVEEWAVPAERPFVERVIRGLWTFVRKKPLGAFCGLTVLVFILIGDLVPESLNKVFRTAGVADAPVPYLADQLESWTGIVYPYGQLDLDNSLEGSSKEHILGTDSIGRDIFSRLLYGARPAIMISFGAVFISGILQILISVPAGYFGGWYDKIMYRIVDVVDSLPSLIILIAIFGLFGRGLWPMVVVIGVLFGFGGRYLRGQTIALAASPQVEAARVIGASNLRIIFRHIVPNLMPLIILSATLRLGIIVLLEASLSFLGYGLPPPFPSWGQMLTLEGREFMRNQPGLAVYPGVAIAILVFSFNLFGDALRDVLDPRLRGNK